MQVQQHGVAAQQWQARLDAALHAPRGVALVIGCNTFPTWNTYPGLFASLACGNPVLVKPHPRAVLPLAISVEIARAVLRDAGFDTVVVEQPVPGHTDYLMSLYQKTGFDTLLKELLDTKVYVGSSAGSMVVCERISSQAYLEIYGEKADYGVTQYMELVDVAIKPHLDSDHFPNNREEKLLEISKTYDGTLYALSDSSALYVNGKNIKIVGHNWLEIIAGKII